MKTTALVLFLLFVVLGGKEVFAQMPASQKITWDVNKEIDLNMSQDAVWEILNQPDLLKRAANGYITSIEIVDPNFPVSRNLVFSDGSKRSENIAQVDKQYKFMVIEINKASLPKGVTEAQIAIFTKRKDEKSSIDWKAKIEGSKEGKQALIDQLKAEFESYAAGFEKMTRKVMPAIKMN